MMKAFWMMSQKKLFSDCFACDSTGNIHCVLVVLWGYYPSPPLEVRRVLTGASKYYLFRNTISPLTSVCPCKTGVSERSFFLTTADL